MRTKSLIRSLAALFVIVILAELLGEALVELADNPILVFIAKPLMMPVLALYYHLSLKGGSRPGWHRYIFAALFFSWLGDLFLMVTWTGENLFLYGLAAFLLAHLMYINGFRLSVAGSPSFLRRMPIAALPVVLYTVGLIYGLMRYDNGDLSAMRFPVMLYAGIIMVMVLAALNRNNAVRYPSFFLAFAGALLFLFSDSLIAVNKFTDSLTDLPILVRILIMSTYAFGQLLIVEGMIRQER